MTSNKLNKGFYTYRRGLCSSLLLLLSAVFTFPSFTAGATIPTASVGTSTGYIYLSQVPYTGFGDFVRLLGFLIIVALWSTLVVLIIKSDKVKEIIRKMFRNVEEDESLKMAGEGGGFVFDLSSNKVLNMNMNPIHDNMNMPESFVSKSSSHGFHLNGNGGVLPHNLPHNEHGEFVPHHQENDLNHRENVMPKGGSDTISDVNAFVNLLVRGDESSVFDYLRKMKAKGISSAEFAKEAVLELDLAYRARQEGDNNKRNIVLSQIISHWSNPKIEAVIGSLLTIVDQSYSDQNVGLKVALLRMMRSV